MFPTLGVFLCLLLLASPQAGAQTDVVGILSASTTWTLAGSPYRVRGHVTVAEGVTLTIRPGVRVVHAPQMGIFVDGTLLARGTAAQPIIFTSVNESRNSWRGVQVRNAGSATLEHCRIGFAGYWENAGVLKTGSGALHLRHSEIHDTNGDGLRIAAGYSAFVSAHNTFRNHARGVRVGLNASFDDNTSDFENNSAQDVHLDGGIITSEVVWNLKPAYSLFLSGHTTVGANSRLRIRPGTVVKPSAQSGLFVDGTLEISGTAKEPVYFTDWSDDTVGGDANGNGDATAPAVNGWRGLQIQNNGSATLDYTHLAYSGYWNNVGLLKTGSGDLTARHVSIRHVNGDAFRVENNTGRVRVEQSVFTTSKAGLRLKQAGDFAATACTFADHTEYGVIQEINDGFDYSANTYTNNTLANLGINSGTLTAETTWHANASPIRVLGHYTVHTNATLTIDPGTRVEVAQHIGLFVDGTLQAQGKATRPIVFTGVTESRNAWRGIQVRNAGSATLAHCRIGFGGYWENAGVLKTGSGALHLTHSDIHDTNGDGLRIAAGYSAFVSAHNTFRNHARGVRVGLNASFDDNTSDFENNSAHDVHLDGGTLAGEVVWNLKPAYSLFMSAHTTVATNGQLRILSGTVVKMAQQIGLFVDGALDVAGTPTAPVHFTVWSDDTVGGDANGTGDATAPAVNGWRGLQIQNNGSATLDYTHLAYSGYWNNVGLLKTGSGDLTARHVSIRHVNGDAFRVENNTGRVRVEQSVFTTSKAGLRLKQAGDFAATACTFADHTEYGVIQEINDGFDYSANTYTNNTLANLGINSGTLTAETTWHANASPIRVLGHYTVHTNATLTIDPGTRVEVAQHIGLFVDGTLQAQGTATRPIVFTGVTESRNAWRGIQVRNAGSATLAHCRIGFGGYWENAGLLKTGSGALHLTHSDIHDTNGDGLRVAAGSSAFVSAHNTFRNHARGVRVGLNASFDDNTSTFDNNSAQNAHLDGGTLTGDVVWNLNPDYSFHLSAHTTVGASGRLQILPGTVVKMAQHIGLFVDGALEVAGTATAPVYLTDWRDDAVGGDANGDGEASAPATGTWRGVQIRNEGAASIVHAHLAYAGHWNNVGLLKSGSGDLTLSHSTIRDVQGNGLHLADSTGDHHILRNQFASNHVGVLLENMREVPVLTRNRIEGNRDFGLRNQTGVEMDARGNWWGDPSGPTHPELNPDGAGDVVSADVLFDPWRTVPSQGEILAPMRAGTIVAGDQLRFTGSAYPVPGAAYLWQFSDGRTSAAQDAGVLVFSEPGEHVITYSASEADVTDPFPDERAVTVVPDPGPLADLRVTAVQAPSEWQVGETVALNYTVRNVGGATASGTWKDAVYLSRDTVPDLQDILLGTTSIARETVPGDAYVRSIDVTLPAVDEGGYHVIVVANDEWFPLERHRLNNEFALAVAAQVPALQPGVARVEPHAASETTEHYYRLTVPESANLLLHVAELDPQLTVYLRYGALPSRRDFDERFDHDGRQVLAGATPGNWYLLVTGHPSAAGAFSVQYDLAELAVADSSPARHGSGMDLELDLHGAGFAAPMQVELVAANGATVEAESVDIVGYTHAVAHFPARTLPTGSCAVRVQRESHEAVLAAAITIVQGGEPKLETQLILPAGTGYNALATLYVEYANTGDATMPAPLLMLAGVQHDRAGAILTLDQHKLSRGFWARGMPQGFSSTVQFLASGDTPGVLRPGESRRVPVYYAGWTHPWDTSGGRPPIEWELTALMADDTTPANWTALCDEMKPDYVQADAWQVLWDNFTKQTGSTWGDYVAMLSRNALYLHRQGARVGDVQSLLAFSMRLADGLSPLNVLAADVDGAITAPGLPLVFERIYMQPISRRFVLGDLGRGWTHNWRQTLVIGEDDSVILSDATGTPRIFNSDSRYANRYLASPGDEGVLVAVDGGLRLTEASGLVQFFRDGRLAYVEDIRGQRITLEYTGEQLTRLTHSAGGALEIQYDAEGRIRQVTSPNGHQTRYSYTGEHLTSVQTGAGQITMYAYYTGPDARQHALTSVTFPDGMVRNFQYDESGRLISVWRDNEQEKVTFAHEDNGRITVTDALGHSSRIFFDHWTRIVRMENALGEATQMAFDEVGQLTRITDPIGMSATLDYDRRGNLAEFTDVMRRTTRFSYTRSRNRLATVTDAMGRQTTRGYDDRGNLTTLTYPDGSREEWTYDAPGNPIRWINRRGHAVQLSYDGIGRITGKTFADGSRAHYEYDARGRLARAENASGDYTLTHNDAGQLTRIAYPGDRWLSFTYDDSGRRVASRDQLGHEIQYHYDEIGRLVRMADATGDLVRYTYDALGRLSEKTTANGAHSVYTYDPAGRLLSLVNRQPDRSVLSSFTYTYDRRGRRIAMDTHYGAWSYTYDDVGQLLRAVLDSTDAAIPSQDIVYEYDALGNRVRSTVNGVEAGYEVGDLNQYTVVGDRAYTYDMDGNLIREEGPDGVTVYSYDDENRLIGIRRGEEEWTYGYDPFGNRVWVDENGARIHYVIDPAGLGNVAGEYSDAGSLVARYAHGLGLVSRMPATGNAAYYTFDPMGNTSEITETGGVPVNRYAYEPFGKALQHVQAMPNPFTFMGQFGVMRDATGLYHARARNLDPQLGRFITPDPIGFIGGDLNLYRYAGNSPISFIDPSGLCSRSVRKTASFWKGVGGVLKVAAGVAIIVKTAPVSVPVLVGKGLIGWWLTTSGAIDTLSGGGSYVAITVDEALGVPEGQGMSEHKTAQEVENMGAAGEVLHTTGIASRDSTTYTAVNVAEDILTTGGKKDAAANAVKYTAVVYCALNKQPVPAPRPCSRVPQWLKDDMEMLRQQRERENQRPQSRLSMTAYADDTAPATLLIHEDCVPGTLTANGSTTIPASWDPNEKTPVAGHGAGNFVRPDQLLSYRIDFENYESATAPAQIVTIRDPLSESLDWNTFEIGEIGFGEVIVPVPPGLKHFQTEFEYVYTDDEYDFAIEVHIEAWLEDGVFSVNFLSIDPETGMPPPVDIGFLPPETDPATGRGQGYVTYLIRPQPDLPGGTEIRNIATIQFDFSLEIDTNQIDPMDKTKGTDPDKEALVSFDRTPPTSRVDELPETVRGTEFEVAWTGQDSESGIVDYAIYVKIDEGDWTLWTNTPALAALYPGEKGHAYAFYSIATDGVGYRENKAANIEAKTVVRGGGMWWWGLLVLALGGILFYVWKQKRN
jgi:RHS repeat-associated protein